MPNSVYAAVAAESCSRMGYSDLRHQRVAELVNQWIDSTEAWRTGYDASEQDYKRQRKECKRWVKQQYKAKYGAEESQAYGCPVFIVIAILSGIISWIVQRTLDRMFARNVGAGDGDQG